MRKITFITPLVASVALVLLSVGPASAAPGDTGTTFEITGGTLAISVPGASVPLGNIGPSALPQVIGPVSLGNVVVTDNRGAVLGWVASVISTAFTKTAPAGTAIAASAISYTPGVATVTGVALVTPTPAPTMTGVSPVQTATVVAGANSATWNPGLTVTVPAGAQAGTYTAVVTHSVV